MGDRKYELPLDEFERLVEQLPPSTVMIDFQGGEPCMWRHLREAVKIPKVPMCLTTNGHHYDVIKDIVDYVEYIVVSQTQCSPQQFDALKKLIPKEKFQLSNHKHILLPTTPVPNSLPANCTVTRTRKGKLVNNVMYKDGRIYYCCNAIDASLRLGIQPPSYDGFDEALVNKKYDLPICGVCACNTKVYSKVMGL